MQSIFGKADTNLRPCVACPTSLASRCTRARSLCRSRYFGGPYAAGQDLAYRNIAYIASALFDYGDSNRPPQQAFEVQRILHTTPINRWAIMMNSWVYWDGVAMRFVPLSDEAITANGQAYTPDVAVAYDLGMGDFLTPVNVERADPIDCYNRVGSI